MRPLEIICAGLVISVAQLCVGGDKHRDQTQSLEEYLRRLPAAETCGRRASPGSLWNEGSVFADLASDARARRINDLVVVRLAAQTIAKATGSVSTKRDYEAFSGIGELAGKINTAGVQSLLSPRSKSKLEGRAETSTQSNLQSTLAGQVVAITDGGLLVVEARRSVLLNNQRETVIVRGVIRPSDVSADNSIASSIMSNLEIELKGKGVISDSTRPPNWLIRTIMKVLLF